MSAFFEVKRKSYLAQRAASQGAAVTLVPLSGEYVAMFECAEKVAPVLGAHLLQELGDGLLEIIPRYAVPLEQMPAALRKLSARFTVALVDYQSMRDGGKWCLVCKLPKESTADILNLESY